MWILCKMFEKMKLKEEGLRVNMKDDKKIGRCYDGWMMGWWWDLAIG